MHRPVSHVRQSSPKISEHFQQLHLLAKRKLHPFLEVGACVLLKPPLLPLLKPRRAQFSVPRVSTRGYLSLIPDLFYVLSRLLNSFKL